MNRFSIFLLTICLVFSCQSEKSTARQETEQVRRPSSHLKPIEDFIPKGYVFTNTDSGTNLAFGHLNDDKIPDFTCLVSNGDLVKVLVFEGADSGFEQVASSGDLTTAFVSNQLNPQIAITPDKEIVIKHQGMRYHYKLRLKKMASGKYHLIESEYENYGNAAHEGAQTVQRDYLKKKRVVIPSLLDKNKGVVSKGTKQETELSEEPIQLAKISDATILDYIQ